MKYYKEQLKRCKATRKLFKAQRRTLHALAMEGFTHVTFHTSTRSITLPFADGVTNEASSGYVQFLGDRIDDVNREADQVKEQWRLELEVLEKRLSAKSSDADEGPSEQGPALPNQPPN
jgi:hypothetical protein